MSYEQNCPLSILAKKEKIVVKIQRKTSKNHPSQITHHPYFHQSPRTAK